MYVMEDTIQAFRSPEDAEEALERVKQRRAEAYKCRQEVDHEFELVREELSKTIARIKKMGRKSPVNISKAAEILGISRQRLNEIINGNKLTR